VILIPLPLIFFNFQYVSNEIYKRYADAIGVVPVESLPIIQQDPVSAGFIPLKTHRVVSGLFFT